MPIESKFVRCDPDDPNRCQGHFKNGQCPYKATEGSKNCPMHSGRGPSNKHVKDLRIYRLAQWQGRVGEIADHDKVKSLREEIGIARMLLENILSQCQDASHLLLYSSKISDLVTRIEKLVSSCHRLEESTGLLLDKQSAIQIAVTIVEIVGRFITDEDTLSTIGDEIIKMIIKAKSEKDK